ncbi:MAG: endolytic transglycosylase MltG, partial [Bacteroidetes bacterium]|nr:endolytic transglycosylase MltG [Bacteroidota bacterium]
APRIINFKDFFILADIMKVYKKLTKVQLYEDEINYTVYLPGFNGAGNRNSAHPVHSPYNTYKYPGLPPGPICIPSIASIDAVLNTEEHDYLFFCAKHDLSGYHVFARSISQHNRNARRYHRAIENRK